MKSIIEKYEEQAKEMLRELLINGEISKGKLLVEEIKKINGKDFNVNYKIGPFPNILSKHNIEKKTVFVHLNRGHNEDSGKELERLKKKYGSDFERYFKDKCDDNKNYPYETFIIEKKFKPFDYKQALFLSGFPESGIELFFEGDESLKNRKLQLQNCYNVLIQKLQLEFIPFPSNVFDSIGSIKEIIEILKPYFEELMDLITLYDRKYVIFASRIYDRIINVYNESVANIVVKKSEEYKLNINREPNPGFTMYKLKWNDKTFYAGIAHTFASGKNIPSYKARKEYGRLCHEKYKAFVEENS